MNPYEFESNSDHGYVCQDCRDFRSGRCPEEDDGGEICERFKLAPMTYAEYARMMKEKEQ